MISLFRSKSSLPCAVHGLSPDPPPSARDLANVTDSISSLPPELRDSLFALLSGDTPAIASSRLVCRAWKDFASPYLITRVVFAKRLKAIAQLQQIPEHAYFRAQVTELVYDTSFYERELARSYKDYKAITRQKRRDDISTMLRGKIRSEMRKQSRRSVNGLLLMKMRKSSNTPTSVKMSPSPVAILQASPNMSDCTMRRFRSRAPACRTSSSGEFSRGFQT